MKVLCINNPSSNVSMGKRRTSYTAKELNNAWKEAHLDKNVTGIYTTDDIKKVNDKMVKAANEKIKGSEVLENTSTLGKFFKNISKRLKQLFSKKV